MNTETPDRLTRRRLLYRAAGLAVAGTGAAAGQAEEAGAGPRVTDAADSIYRNGDSKSLLSLKKSGTGYVGSIVMGVHTG